MRQQLLELLFMDNMLSAFAAAPPTVDFSQAVCRDMDTEIFFSLTAGDISTAKDACRKCPAQQACLDYAMYSEEYGVWGGKTPKERKLIRGNKGIVTKEEQVAIAALKQDLLSNLPPQVVADKHQINVRTCHRWRKRLRAA